LSAYAPYASALPTTTTLRTPAANAAVITVCAARVLRSR
jgi:hypothetical protein